VSWRPVVSATCARGGRGSIAGGEKEDETRAWLQKASVARFYRIGGHG
jgi:hypothetical protein